MYGPKILYIVPLVSVEKADTQPGRPDYSQAQPLQVSRGTCFSPSTLQVVKMDKYIGPFPPQPRLVGQ